MWRSDEARRRRAAAARRWQPDPVDLLLVDEAPPSALDRYFYFEDVTTQDSLFRYVVAGVLGVRPTRDKAPLLAELREAGVFLVDACADPFHHRREALTACLPDLVARVEGLRPRRVVLVGAALYDLAFTPLRAAGAPVVDARLPYPGSGQQRRFAEGFAAVLARS
jgi:phage terminase large subunit-like protein